MRILPLTLLTALACSLATAAWGDDVADFLAKVPPAPASLAEALKSCSDYGAWDSFDRREDFSQRQLAQQALMAQNGLSMMNMDDRIAFSEYAAAATPPVHDPSQLMKGPLVQGMPAFTPPGQRGESAALDKKIYAALDAWVKQAHAWWVGQSDKVKGVVAKPPAPFKPKHPDDQALVPAAAAQVTADRLPLVKQLADASRQVCETAMSNVPASYLPNQ